MINLELLEKSVDEALALFKVTLYEVAKKNHYIPVSDEIKKHNNEITDRYISRRFNSILEDSPYTIKYVEYEENNLVDKGGSAIRSYLGKFIELNESNPRLTNFETFIHEWAHHILHLRRNAIKKDHFVEELEAETIAFIVGLVLGHIDEFSHLYILDKFDDNLTEEERINILDLAFKESDMRIKRTSLRILNKMKWTITSLNYHLKNDGKRL